MLFYFFLGAEIWILLGCIGYFLWFHNPDPKNKDLYDTLVTAPAGLCLLCAMFLGGLMFTLAFSSDETDDTSDEV
jgi:hypothetical protein